MKKLLLLLMAVLTTSVAMAAYDFSAVAPTGQTLYYKIINPNEVAITYPGSSDFVNYSGYVAPSGNLEIPAQVSYNGTDYSVTSIGNYAFFSLGSLTQVTIPNTVTSIGNRSFANSLLLTDVSIPNSVVTIGEAAFEGCGGIFCLNIPSTVTSIGMGAFYMIRNIIYQGSYSTNSPWGANVINGFIDGDLVYADYSRIFLAGCKSDATTVVIPNTVTTILQNAFFGCQNLTSIVIPNSVTTIRPGAFARCNSLSNVTLPNNLRSIDISTFADCKSLSNLTIPNLVTSIGQSAFSGCSALTSINIPSGVTSIGAYAFSSCTGLTSITIPNSVTSIEDGTFRDCNNLFSVTIPSSVTRIAYSAFTGVTHVSYSGSASGSPWGATYANKYLTGDLLFENSNKTNLLRCRKTASSVTIPTTVTTIVSDAFDGCSKLFSVSVPSSVTSIGSYAFRNVKNIVYNGTATGSPWGALSVNGYVDGILIFTDYTKASLVGCNVSAVNVTIPNSVTSIGPYAFAHCNNLSTVEIPNSVTTIGSFAFYYCSNLNSVSIPNSITSIPQDAFGYCTRLTTVDIPNSVTYIGWFAFTSCTGLTSVSIPNSVTSIADLAFGGCTNLTTVYDYSNLAITKGSTSNGYVANYANRVEKILTDNRGDFNAPSTYTVDKVTYTRSYEQGKRSTLCLPFKPTSVSPSGLKYYRFRNFDGSTIFFEEVAFNDLAANTPYMVEWPATKTPQDYVFSATDATIVASNSTTRTVNGGNGGSFNGTIARTCMNNTCYGYRDGYFVQSSNGSDCNVPDHAHVNPFRAYFQITSSSPSGSNPSGLAADFSDGDNLGIEEVDEGASVETSIRYSTDVYDMMGRLVRRNAETLRGLPKGIYIWKGKKVLAY